MNHTLPGRPKGNSSTFPMFDVRWCFEMDPDSYFFDVAGSLWCCCPKTMCVFNVEACCPRVQPGEIDPSLRDPRDSSDPNAGGVR